MSIDKKKVEEDWLSAFPLLKRFAYGKFYTVSGPVVLGIELKAIPRTKKYRPHFVMYGLYGNKVGIDLKSAFTGPIIQFDFSSNKGFELEIGYDIHDELYEEAILLVKQQLPFSFDESIAPNSLLRLFDLHANRFPLSAAKDSFLQASLLRNKYIVALLMEEDVNKILLELNSINWDQNHFELCGINLKIWLNAIKNIDKVKLSRIVDANKSQPKLSKII